MLQKQKFQGPPLVAIFEKNTQEWIGENTAKQRTKNPTGLKIPKKGLQQTEWHDV